MIKTPDIGDKQVTERKLADGSVTSSKLSTEIANMLSLLTTRISAFKVADNLSSLPTEENTIGWLVDNHLYVYVGNGSTPESGMYQDCGELRGPQGIQGEQGLSGLNGKSAYDIWTEQPGNEDKSEIDFLEFTRGSKGDKGDQGERGYDISNIEQIVKSTEDGGKNIIRVTRSDGWSKVFEIFNGSKGSKGDKGTSIVKLEQTRKTTESSGLNTIEATLGDGTKESFEIYNGAKGEQGDKGEKGDNGDQGKIGPQGNSGIADASNKTLVNDAITGGETDFLSAEVGKLGILTYDCSKGGTVTHTTLQDAINSVPTTFQKVGLTITYKSGDTIYRYTLKANAWSADQTNWFSVEDKLSELSKSAYNYEFFCQAQTVSFKYGPSFSVTMHIVMYNGSKNLGYFYKKGSTIETYATLESDDVTFTLKNYSYLYVDLKDNKVKVSQEDLLSYDDRLVLLANFQAETLGFSIGLMAPYINTLKQNAVAKASYRLYSKSKIVVNRISQYQSSITISTDKKLGQIGWLSYDSINGLYLYNEGNELTKTYVLNHSDLLVANSEGILSVVSYSTYSGYPVGFTVLAYLHEDKIVGILNEYITSENASDKLSELSKSAYNYDNIIRTIQRCGYSGDGAPFQSLQAYRDAIKHGFSILLADLMFTRDNVPVCSHDYYLNQYYSNVYNSDGNLVDKSLQIYIREKTYEELLAYDWGAGKYKGTKLLKFEDFVKFCKINGVSEMYVEIKELTSDIQASIACNIVKKYNMKEKTSFAADSKNTLKLILNHLPYTRVATMPSTIDDNTINELLSINNGKCKLFFFAWDTTTLSNDIVKKLIDNNIDFEFGTLNTKEKVKEYFNRGNIYLYCAGVESNSLHIGNILKELEI